MSVIVPAYDVAPFLGEALESVLAQTVPADEVETIVVDDGSADDTAAVAARYAPRVRLERRSHRGVSATRNAGLAVATGEWIAFLDGDDRFWPESLGARLAAAARHPDAALVYSGVRYVDVGGRPLPQRGWATIEGDVLADLVVANRVHVHQVLVRRDAIAAAGGFDESLRGGEDWDLWIRLARAGVRWACVDAPLADYRIRPGGAHRDPSRMADGLVRVVERVFDDPTLPAGIAARRALAFHTTHLLAACHHYRGGDEDGGVRHVRAAVRAQTTILTEVPAQLEFCRQLLPVGYQRGSVAARDWRRLTGILRRAVAAVLADPALASIVQPIAATARRTVWRTTATLVARRARRLGRATPLPLPA